jgi:hypothetical protein
MSFKFTVMEPENLYFKNNEIKESVLRDSSSYEKYIILMNETLQQENKVLKEQMNELETKINDYEEEIDKYDTSKRYTKGLLKNLVELEKLSSQLNENTIFTYSNYQKIYNQKLNTQKSSLRIYYILASITLAFLFQIDFLDLNSLTIIVSSFLYNIYANEFYFNRIIVPDIPENNKALIEKIQKIKNSQDYLNDYIDNL